MCIQSYSYLSNVYDDLMYDVDYDEWSDYIDSLLKNHKNTSQEIYEAGCGTGQISVRLAKKGHSMLSTDISEEMLEKASENARKHGVNIRIALQDMRNANCTGNRDAVIACCDAVNYLLTDKDLIDFFKSAHTILKEDGLLLFDISSEYKLEHILGNELFYEDGEETTYFLQSSFNNNTKCVKMELTLFVLNGDVYERYDEEHIQKAHSIKNITEILEKTGFDKIKAYRFLTQENAGSKDERIQFTALKKGLKK